ncbi:MAG: flagellar assembly protein FliX [Desulfarculus sp.]|nr:flagellar assembly protein FliX [Desulfarculus sp.]
MKVSGAGRGAPISGGARKVGKSDGKGEFKKALVEAMEVMEDVHAAEAPSALASVDAVLMAQSVGDSTDRESRQRMIRHAEDILDRLEEVRRGLLLGIVPRETLNNLAQMVRARRETAQDPRLAALLDEIELRAEVEIAKLSRAGG